MYKSIIFDVDGTILDTERAILKGLQHTLKEETGKEYPFEDLQFALGIPGKETLRKLDIREVDRVHLAWCEAVLTYSRDVSVFHEMEDVLNELAQTQMKLGVVTSKTKQELKDEFEPFGLHPLFEHIVCADDTDRHKPHPDPLITCLEALDTDPGEAIYIGDSQYDRQCAEEAGVQFGLATWGAKSEFKPEPEYLFSTPADILKILG